jgi:hypothetical protein
MTDHPPPLFFTRFSAGLFAGLLFTASHVVSSICTLLIYKNHFVISQFRTLTGIGILYHYHRHFILQIGKAIFQIGNPALARLLALLQFLKLEFQLAYRGLRIIDFLFQTFQINPE